MKRLHVISEFLPYASIILRHLRDKSTEPPLFREWLRRAGFLLGIVISKSLPLRHVIVKTPLGEAVEAELDSEPLIINVLGAGEFLVDGLLEAYPKAPVALVAARRIEDSEVRVVVSYERLPREWKGPSIVADPMLATGMTARSIVDRLLRIGSTPVIIASVISAWEGIERVLSAGGNVVIYTLAVDRELNNMKFIVPGLGDAGDRSLGVRPG